METLSEDLLLLISEEKYELALVQIEAKLDAEPSHANLLYWAGFCYLQIHNPIAAIHALQNCLEHDILPEYHVAYMIAHFDAADFKQALSLIQEGLQQYPDEAQYWRYLAFITARTDFEQAEAFFAKSRALSPKEAIFPASQASAISVERAISWLPKDAQEWLDTLSIHIAENPSIEQLQHEDFPHHPLLPFLLQGEELYIFVNNLRYHYANQSAESYLFEQLLDLWNHLQQTNNPAAD